jgi:hypothetical protein
MARHTNIDNNDDVIDSRDVISRLEELKDEREALTDAVQEWEDENLDTLKELEQDAPFGGQEKEDALVELRSAYEKLTDAVKEWDDDNGEELKALEALNEEGENSADDWTHGATLVRESYFEEYAQQLVEDIGDMPKGVPSYIVIDWAATAENLKADYTEVDYDGVTYLVR